MMRPFVAGDCLLPSCYVALGEMAADRRDTIRRMSLAKAKAIGRKRRRNGRLWPMPVRETDLGHIYAEVTVRPLAGSAKSWKGRALVDTGATDTFLPASVLRKLGIQRSARRSYELADGTEQELPI